MQNHIWVVQVLFPRTGKWENYAMAHSRAEARRAQKATCLTTRIRKFIAA